MEYSYIYRDIIKAKATRIACSACAPSVVNGYPLHERGCPNDTRECSGCNARIPANVKYCEDCR